MTDVLEFVSEIVHRTQTWPEVVALIALCLMAAGFLGVCALVVVVVFRGLLP